MFLRLGYDGTTLDAVAEAVGVTKPAIYYHFKSKDGLFKELFSGMIEGTTADYFAMLQGANGPNEMLDVMFGSMSEIEAEFSSTPDAGIDLAYLPFMIDAARRFPELRELLDGFYTRTIELIVVQLETGKETGEVRLDLDCRMAALALVSEFEGLLLVGSIAKSCDDRGMELGIAELFRRGMASA